MCVWLTSVQSTSNDRQDIWVVHQNKGRLYFLLPLENGKKWFFLLPVLIGCCEQNGREPRVSYYMIFTQKSKTGVGEQG